MTGKRQAGILILAVITILLSILRLLGTGSIFPGFSRVVPSPVLAVIVIYSVVSNIGYILASVNMLRLKEYARRLFLCLTAVQFVYMAAVSMPLASKSIEAMKSSPEILDRVWQGYSAIPEEMRLEKNIEKDAYMDIVFRLVHRMANTINVISLIYLLIIIFYLTRAKVKKQFLSQTVSAGAGI
jgi:hypothetical protein